jgi:23S rRNA (uracil1939-C5)-methyltransferase
MRKPKNQILENITITDFAAEGRCIAKIDGEAIFIDGPVAPGDVVDVRITRVKKNFKEGVAQNIRPLSGHRAATFCEHFGLCGGCKWQHIEYGSQLAFKQKQVEDALQRIAKVAYPTIEPILASEQTTYYRNKLEFTFAANRWLTTEEIQTEEKINRNALGFHIPKRFDKIFEMKHCYLQPDPSNQIRLAIRAFAEEKGYVFFELVHQKGFLRNLTIRTANTGDVMVIVQVAEPRMDEIMEIMDFLKNSFPQITSLNYVINQKGNDTIFDQEVICVAGKPYIEEEMEGLRFRVGPKSFYQTNGQQAYNLYRIARDFAQLKGDELVYDLYTGTGTIANFVAQQARKVIGLEYIEMAIEDAKINSEINGITNTEFFAGDMRYLLSDTFVATHGRPDVVITDPPRAGMDEEVVNVLKKAAPQRIVYVSCNPATQARDLAWLDDTYEVRAVQPVDMFPHTHHVENVVWLEKRS